MDKAERRRRRQRREQQAGSPEATPTAGESQDSTSNQNSEGASFTAAEDLPAGATETGHTQEPAAASARPAAMAEVLRSTFPQTTHPTDEETASANTDPFFQRKSSNNEFAAAERPPASAAPEQAPPLSRDVSPRPQPASRGTTRDPVLLALLLAALVVLAIDTYFTIRLNGLSDRLSAMAGKPVVASAAPATDRPWIGIGSIKTAPFANGGQPVTTVRFGNSGSEPAYDFRSNTVGSLRPSGSAPPDIPAQKGPVASAGVLVPNAEGILTFFANTRALTADEAGRVRSGQLVLWLAGRLDYRDRRGKTHLTTFRYQFNPTLSSFVAAPQGNTAT